MAFEKRGRKIKIFMGVLDDQWSPCFEGQGKSKYSSLLLSRCGAGGIIQVQLEGHPMEDWYSLLLEVKLGWEDLVGSNVGSAQH